MKPVFIIGSVLISNSGKFDYTENRSYFSDRERHSHTTFAINSIYAIYPNSKVYVVDASLDTEAAGELLFQYEHLWKAKDLECIRLAEVDAQKTVILNTHENKSYCEALLYSTFLKHYKDELKNYDYIVKLSGRYNLTENCGTDLINKSDVYFKKIWDAPNPDKEHWAYKDLMMPGQEPWEMNWTPSFCFAFGINRLEEFVDFWNFVLENTKENDRSCERLIQYWLWKNKLTPKELSWKILAFTGDNGRLWYW